MLLSLLCAFYSLPGPPASDNGAYQLYGINRRLCPEIDPLRDVIFQLYTRKNPVNPQILLTGNNESVISSNIDFNYPTIIFFHGFMDPLQYLELRDRYLQKDNYNIFMVNARRLMAGPDYITAAINIKPIGKFAAQFIDYLVTLGLNVKKLHVIGLSMGGQVAALTCKQMESGTASRLSALDPIGPFYDILPASEGLRPTDADFVDIIHTDASLTFNFKVEGHVNIWFNGGIFQPSCSILEIMKRNELSLSEIVFCSHVFAYKVYVVSILNPTAYKITKCTSYEEYESGACDSNESTYLGEGIDLSARGNYYITNNSAVIL